MENVHDRAHELARALKNSQQYRRYRRAEAEIQDDDESLELIEKFRAKQMEYQAQQFMGEELDESAREELAGLRQVLEEKPEVREYLQAEVQLVQLLADVQEIVAEAVSLHLPGTSTEPPRPAGTEDGVPGEDSPPPVQ